MGEVVDKGACGEGLQMEHVGKASNGACGEGLQMEHVGRLQMEHVGIAFKWSTWGRTSNGACVEGFKWSMCEGFKWSMWEWPSNGARGKVGWGDGLQWSTWGRGFEVKKTYMEDLTGARKTYYT